MERTGAATTIVDLARELGLSKTTVADALNGTGRVSQATRELVQRTAVTSGYRVNRSARQLRTRTGETVGLYVGADVRNMPFYMPFTFGVMEEAATHEYDVTLLTHLSKGSPLRQLVGAIVIDALPDDPVLRGVLDLTAPVVSAGRLAAAEADTAGRVEIDYPAVIRQALDRLAAVGSSAPALIAPLRRDPSAWSELIVRAYRTWCGQRKQRPAVLRLPPYASNAELESALDSALTDSPVDGFLVSWQDVADRGQILLRNRLQQDSPLPVAAIIDSYLEAANYPHDVLIDLGARAFGREALQVLHLVAVGSVPAPVRRVHQVRILERRRGTSEFVTVNAG